MEIKNIIGTSYLCSRFTNSDGTIVSDHPLFIFGTDDENTLLGVMFTQKENPYTTKYRNGTSIRFSAMSTRDAGIRGNVDIKGLTKTFQAEMYIIDKNNVKLSEYTFANRYHNMELAKALRNSLKEGIETNLEFGMKHLHKYNNAKEEPDTLDVVKKLYEYINNVIKTSNINLFPVTGLVNTTYDEMRKYHNEYSNKNYNKDKINKKR